MKKNIKTHRTAFNLCLICLCFVISLPIIFCINLNTAFAERNAPNTIGCTLNNGVGISPTGLYTNLSLNLFCGNGKIWATVKNDFTLFPSKVQVTVELYSSDKKCISYTDMIIEKSNSTEDLNMGKTITVECNTGNMQKYWRAVMIYKIDNNPWKTKETKTVLCDANGNVVN